MRHTFALTALAAALVAAAPAHAQRTSLADRVAALEVRAATPAVSVELLNQIAQMRTELQALRSQVEELQQQNEQLRNSARVQYLDLDSRVMRLEGGAAPATGAPVLTDVPAAAATADAPAAVNGSASAPALSLGAPVAGEQASYDAAFAHLKAGDYAAAARAFDAFLRDYPSGTYAPNARYWLGESYYVTQNYRLALPQFQAIVEQHPQHDKAPGALLKVGLTQQGLKDFDAAERALREVTQRYPNTDAARTAADRLQALELTRLR